MGIVIHCHQFWLVEMLQYFINWNVVEGTVGLVLFTMRKTPNCFNLKADFIHNFTQKCLINCDTFQNTVPVNITRGKDLIKEKMRTVVNLRKLKISVLLKTTESKMSSWQEKQYNSSMEVWKKGKVMKKNKRVSKQTVNNNIVSNRGNFWKLIVVYKTVKTETLNKQSLHSLDVF